MGKLKFIIKRLKDMDYKALFEMVKKLHKKTGKLRTFLFFDIIICGFRYGAGYKDYELYEFWKLPAKLRKTYVVRTTNNLIIAHCNKKEFYHCLNDKIEFNTRYDRFLKRDWLDFRTASKNDFISFISGKTAIIAKPVDQCCGIGVKKAVVSDYESYDAMYEALKNDPSADLLEDYIVQHPLISAIYPYSVNTIRVMTILKGNDVHIIFAAIRIGNNGKVVDNINNGGLASPVDIDTGEILFPGYDKDGNEYAVHPMTKHPIKGFMIPFWKEAVEMVKEAALVTPELRYCGWDVAITENGPLFVEANHMPGYDILQLPAHNPSRIGMKPVYNAILGDEMKI